MAIGRLPPEDRLLFALHYVAGLPSGDVGCALGIPAATVRFRLALVRRKPTQLPSLPQH